MQPQTFLISKINNKKQKYISLWKQNILQYLLDYLLVTLPKIEMLLFSLTYSSQRALQVAQR